MKNYASEFYRHNVLPIKDKKKTSQYHQNVAFSYLAWFQCFDTTHHLAKSRTTIFPLL